MVTAMLMMVVTVENGGDGELDDSETVVTVYISGDAIRGWLCQWHRW